jgi:maltooligosyltrehalose trehalohydrolase
MHLQNPIRPRTADVGKLNTDTIPQSLVASRRFPAGAERLSNGQFHFRVWAPKRRQCELVLVSDGNIEAGQTLNMIRDAEGYFSLGTPVAKTGMRYGFRLEGDQRVLPDPVSRFQPDGPAMLSQLVDPSTFSWNDQRWQGVSRRGQVIYEMHIGTFTPEGTWEAAARELDELARLGVTIVEVMPVAEFHGQFGWGYDGVLLFAPSHLYGLPDDFRRFVDRAHTVGLGVILDVVYNHFGICDNYLYEFSDDYRSKRYDNEWADAINFDGDHCIPVREFFTTNARYWIEEFHLDGYRFDAIQAVHDQSPAHILADISAAARQAAANRSIFLSAENELQDVRTVKSNDPDGLGMDAMWNDDFHHMARVRATGRNPAYYSDYSGSPQEFITTLKHGFIYQGQRSGWQGKRRGTPTRGLAAQNFICFLQNHDQVANSIQGERLHELTSPGRFRALTALWLLAPQTPLVFQGQEFAASAPFLYFADYDGELGEAVTQGRAKFFSQFPALASPEVQACLPDPTGRKSFQRSKLDLSERRSHAAEYALHIDLLRLRREDSVFRQQCSDLIDAAVINADCLIVRYFGEKDGDDRLVIANFGCDFKYPTAPQPLLAPPMNRRWSVLWNSENRRYGGRGECPVEVDEAWFFPGESAIVLRAQFDLAGLTTRNS